MFSIFSMRLSEKIRRFQTRPGKWPTQIFLISIYIIHVIVKISVKLYGLGVWAQQNTHLKEKKYSFFTDWQIQVFKDKFGLWLRATHKHKDFLRDRKYGRRGPRGYEKKLVQVLPKIVARSQKQFFQISESFGAKYLLRA